MVVDPATVHALAKDNRLLKAAAAKGKETRQATDLTLFANASYSGHADYLEQMVRFSSRTTQRCMPTQCTSRAPSSHIGRCTAVC